MLMRFWMLLVALTVLMSTAAASAETILFVPHDDRPVSRQQPIEVVAQLGVEIQQKKFFREVDN